MSDYKRYQQATALSTDWENISTILQPGELAYSQDEKTFKIGDGLNTWSSGNYIITSLSLQTSFLDITASISAQPGDILIYYDNNFGWIFSPGFAEYENGSFSFSLNILSDVSLTSLQDFQILLWDYAQNSWVNSDVSTSNITTMAAPTVSTDPGEPGEIRFDNTYIYVCISTDTWKRSELFSW